MAPQHAGHSRKNKNESHLHDNEVTRQGLREFLKPDDTTSHPSRPDLPPAVQRFKVPNNNGRNLTAQSPYYVDERYFSSLNVSAGGVRRKKNEDAKYTVVRNKRYRGTGAGAGDSMWQAKGLDKGGSMST